MQVVGVMHGCTEWKKNLIRRCIQLEQEGKGEMVWRVLKGNLLLDNPLFPALAPINSRRVPANVCELIHWVIVCGVFSMKTKAVREEASSAWPVAAAEHILLLVSCIPSQETQKILDTLQDRQEINMLPFSCLSGTHPKNLEILRWTPHPQTVWEKKKLF